MSRSIEEIVAELKVAMGEEKVAAGRVTPMQDKVSVQFGEKLGSEAYNKMNVQAAKFAWDDRLVPEQDIDKEVFLKLMIQSAISKLNQYYRRIG